MRTKRELIKEWKGWTLTIPRGTPVETDAAGDRGARVPLNGYAIAVVPSFVPERMRSLTGPRSIFAHDARHYWLWIDKEECEP